MGADRTHKTHESEIEDLIAPSKSSSQSSRFVGTNSPCPQVPQVDTKSPRWMPAHAVDGYRRKTLS